MKKESNQSGFIERQYSDKPRDYFDIERAEMLEFLPANHQRLLDVGCGAGAFGAAIKQISGAEVWGIEPDKASAEVAAGRLDQVRNGLFSAESDLPLAYFDCIIFNDVLEHMLDPAAAICLAKNLLKPGGAVVASIPNIGHFPTIWRLVLRGEWKYSDRGILDRTHLRFFTRKSIRNLFESNSYNIQSLKGINAFARMSPSDDRLWKYYKMLALIPKDGIRDMKFLQFGIRATLG